MAIRLPVGGHFAGRFGRKIVRFLMPGEKIARFTWIGEAAYRMLPEQEFAEGQVRGDK